MLRVMQILQQKRRKHLPHAFAWPAIPNDDSHRLRSCMTGTPCRRVQRGWPRRPQSDATCALCRWPHAPVSCLPRTDQSMFINAALTAAACCRLNHCMEKQCCRCAWPCEVSRQTFMHKQQPHQQRMLRLSDAVGAASGAALTELRTSHAVLVGWRRGGRCLLLHCVPAAASCA